ncbi:GNAT family N-acetyltransferase [Nocardioides mesophilus]|uniref:GNAT family N-acetyltransferase n=1 Tax=Nocardioides mesophilus TaxID=433659 RepID=A0A7G9R772_9ACTN|nr:GNAT family N-acetyltransferase [Nocardioides mesophilus]QNN51447.1 GNAT family N-acetyltransferase [Nocardioides mesophilus]
MRILALDPADKPALRQWHRTGAAAHRHDRPDTPLWTEDEALLIVTDDDPEERMYPYLVLDEQDEAVGSGIVFVPVLDNLDKAYSSFSVVPAHRGRGAGTAALQHAEEVARAEGRGLLLVQGYFPVSADDGHPVRAFALRHGLRLANAELRRVQELPIPDERIQAWVEEAAAHHEGYELRTYVDTVPEELLPSLVDLHNQLAVDAPTGEIDFEAGQMTVEIFRSQVERRLASGRRALVSVAVHDGATVAHSTLSVPPKGEELPHVSQWGTYVDRRHRGHRLGLAVKAANLRALQREFPERTLVHTTNSPQNGPMVSINEQMGFRPVEVMGEFLLDL